MKQFYLLLLIAFPLIGSGQDLISVNTEPVQPLQGFQMSANPAHGDEVNITTAPNGSNPINVYDICGEAVLHARITTNTLDISRLVPGVYVLQVSEDKKTMTRKLVVK